MQKKTKEQDAPPVEKATVNWEQYTEVSGLEQVRQEDLGIPFLMILQATSPELKKTSQKYIAGAAAGDVINTLTREIVHTQGGEPITVIPCVFERLYVEWKPRDAGGGLVRSHRDAGILTECKRNEKNQDILPNGNVVVNTCYFFLQRLSEKAPERAVISMASTQGKKARAWLNLAMSCRSNTGGVLPFFSHTYLLSTVPEQNAQGEWFGWKIERMSPVTDRSLIEGSAAIARQVTANAKRLISSGEDAAAESY